MPLVNTDSYGELAILPFPAQAPVSETLAWLTHINNSRNGTEYSSEQLRSKPRQSFQYEYPEQAWLTQSGFNTQYQALRRRWAVPVWAEMQAVGALGMGDTVIDVDTTTVDLRVGGLVLVFSSTSNWELLEINAKSGTSITVDALAASHENAKIIPVRVGAVAGNITRRTAGFGAMVSVEFEVNDNIELTVAAPAQFLGDDIDYTEMLREGMYEKAIAAEVDVIDFELGSVARIAPWSYARQMSVFHVEYETLAEVKAFRNWLARRAGRYRRFWQPSYEHDLRVVSTGTITTSIVFKRDDYQAFTQGRAHIAIQSHNGTWYPRTLSDVTDTADDTHTATLNTALNLDASLIARVSYLGLKRLDTDRIELQWPGAGVCRSSFTVTEVSP